jgi:NAD(P)-dependent dehydrogenase (short-subunit alcohol dehydrogenase family)
MLRGASLELAMRGWIVSVVGRRHARLASLAADAARLGAAGRIVPVPVDYRDSGELAGRLRAAKAAEGPVELAVCWIHSTAPGAHGLVAEMVASERAPCRYFEILGASAAPDRAIEEVPGILYRRIRLGFIIEPGGSRWLTNDEIASGTIEAIDRDEREHPVGLVHPWSARPP